MQLFRKVQERSLPWESRRQYDAMITLVEQGPRISVRPSLPPAQVLLCAAPHSVSFPPGQSAYRRKASSFSTIAVTESAQSALAFGARETR